MAKRYYWLKLKEDFFRQRQIKRLRKIAGGDTFTIIYLKMLLLAMKDDGRIALDGFDFSEELALELDEDAENVKMTVGFLLNSGLMEEINGNEMFVPAAIENVGSESSSAERVRKFREKQKVLEAGSETLQLPIDTESMEGNNQALQCNANVTTEIEIREREKRIEKDKEREIEKETGANAPDPVPYSQIQKLFNDLCPSFPKVLKLNEARKKAIKARWIEYDRNPDAFIKLFTMAEASSFLKGRNERNWTATFDWLLNTTNMTKVLEGNYKDKGENHHANNHNTQPSAGDQRAITTAELEEKLRREGSFKGYPDFDKMFAEKRANTPVGNDDDDYHE